MSPRKTILALLLALPFAAAVFFDAPEARGDAAADKALAAVVKKGAALWKKTWRRGAKACFSCHTRGPNKMTGRRMDAYPKYDKTLKQVVTVQQKLNQMIKSKSGGKPLDLGHADLTALEAYMKTLK